MNSSDQSQAWGAGKEYTTRKCEKRFKLEVQKWRDGRNSSYTEGIKRVYRSTEKEKEEEVVEDTREEAI